MPHNFTPYGIKQETERERLIREIKRALDNSPLIPIQILARIDDIINEKK